MITSKMKVIMVASEIEPFAKTGGLADVTSAIAKYLKELGAQVISIMPLYSSIDRDKYKIKKVFDISCAHMGTCEEFYSVYTTKEPYGVDTYFIEFDKYFNRDGIYNDTIGEFIDNPFRFALLSRAALQIAKDLKFKPDIVHVNDWQTALIPYYLKTDNDPFFAKTKSVLTIHNIGYQGSFSSDVVGYAGIHDHDFHAGTFESFNGINFLKGGISYADKITTVSPTYAHEILGPIGSNGLHGKLDDRRDDLVGILNGIDTDIWNPSKDKLIPKNFDIKTYKAGKKALKKQLQLEFDLEVNPNIPLLSFIGRFAEQKGLGLLAGAVEHAVNTMDAQFIILGSGDEDAQWYFGGLPTAYSGKIGAFVGYNESKAHLIEAGSDFFLMPSLYEPCGLNQMYSQAYGTLPIVRATGGLEDTVDQYDEATGDGTGFKFYDISAQALYNTIGWAISTYFDRPKHMDKMIKAAMSKDFSWEKHIKEYLELYKSMFKK